MGCPAVSGTATCEGYELTRDLDFDTDGDGVHPHIRHQRLGRHLPQLRQRLGSHRPGLDAERQHPLQRRVRRQRPLDPQPLRRPQPQLRRAVRGAARQRRGALAGAAERLRGHQPAGFGGAAGGVVVGPGGGVVGERLGGGQHQRRRPGGVDGGEFGDRGQLLEGVGAVRRGQRWRPGGRQRRNHRRQLRDRGDHRQLRGDQQARPGRLHRHGHAQPLGPRDERRHDVRPGRRPHHGAAEDPDVGHRHLRRLGGHGRGRRRRTRTSRRGTSAPTRSTRR